MLLDNGELLLCCEYHVLLSTTGCCRLFFLDVCFLHLSVAVVFKFSPVCNDRFLFLLSVLFRRQNSGVTRHNDGPRSEIG